MKRRLVGSHVQFVRALHNPRLYYPPRLLLIPRVLPGRYPLVGGPAGNQHDGRHPTIVLAVLPGYGWAQATLGLCTQVRQLEGSTRLRLRPPWLSLSAPPPMCITTVIRMERPAPSNQPSGARIQ